ncbi:MAG: GTP cyclohydrolase I FolE2 [Desulfobulbaceae bacterium]|uniref:GTP cyclohydrolase I FolE2 n=1 Tax=Candidatus Desulfatifera sulfidica TaxID=2841691 RepID=A0A8J6TDS7_9BACT|nr:GTP cyclohydrolase I FolE2 [Candidatus Desulfatifera sulfidica]
MKDIQSQLDHRRINIKKVGVKTISYPITVLDKARDNQRTVATVNMYVNLPHHFKGTHMSRFVEILNRFHGRIDLESFHQILEEMKAKLDAEAAHLEMNFDYFLPHESQQVGLKAACFPCRMHGSLEETDELEFEFAVPIALPLKESIVPGLPRSLGRWGTATVAVRFRRFIWIEELITLVQEAVAQHQRLLVHAEEFSVESLTRSIGHQLSDLPAIKWFSVNVENLAEGYATFATTESDCSIASL